MSNTEPLLIVDGHLDMAFNALHNRRDLTQPVQLLREREDSVSAKLSEHPDSLEQREGPWPVKPTTVTVSLPEMRRAKVGIMLSTIMARVQAPGPKSHNAVRTREVAYAVGQSHLHYYKSLKRAGQITFIKTIRDLDACINAWADPDPETPIGLILSMESADPILDPGQVEQWWQTGLRSVSLTHFGANTYGHGTGAVGGLYPPAYALMDALRGTDIAIDLSHAADLTFWQIMEYWDGPVHASHCHCRALVSGQRHLSDDMITAIVERGGVIGMVFGEHFLNPRWNWDDPASHTLTATRPMKAIIDHIDHICQLCGSADHVAIGSDLDGGYGRELSPTDLNTIADLQVFLNILRREGYQEKDVAKIAHGNLLRFFRNAWRTN